MTARVLALLFLFIANVAWGQIAPTRSWLELNEAVQDRVNRNAYPLTGYDKEEVREVLSRIKSLDRDEWARSWIEQGDRHLTQAKSAVRRRSRQGARGVPRGVALLRLRRVADAEFGRQARGPSPRHRG